jgi:hypothetical protein
MRYLAFSVFDLFYDINYDFSMEALYSNLLVANIYLTNEGCLSGVTKAEFADLQV